MYRQLITDLGVEINLTKSFPNLIGSGEFAKRIFYKGKNISGFGYQMVKAANADEISWIRYLEILISEGFLPASSPLLLPQLEDLSGLPNKLRTKLA
jgi:hypothetical protein